jgi:8-oxo-dGTP diphosphatase
MRTRPGACIIQNNKILLLRYEYNGIDVFNIPGGNHENSEMIADTLKREMLEELGINIQVDDLVLVAEATNKSVNNEVLHLIFKCHIIEYEPIINKNECSAIEAVWLPIEKLKEVNLYPFIGADLFQSINSQNYKIYLGKFQQPWY